MSRIFRRDGRQNLRKSRESSGKNPGFFVAIRKLFVAICLFGVVALIGKFVYGGVQDVKQLSLAELNNSGIDERDLDMKFRSGDIFTVLLVVTDLDEQSKEKIESFAIVRLDQEESTAFITSVDPDIYMSPTGYMDSGVSDISADTARIRDLMVVGNLNTPPIPEAYALYQIENLYALNVDGYVVVDKKDFDSVAKLGGVEAPWSIENTKKSYEEFSTTWNEYWKNMLLKINLFKVWANRNAVSAIKSNMPAAELYKFVMAFQGVPENKISLISVEDKDLTEIVNERGENVKYVSRGVIDASIGAYCDDVRIEREQALIEVFNGSGVNGLGAGYRRLVEHMGGSVIRVENASGDNQKTVIYATDPSKYPLTIEKVKSLFKYDVEVLEGRPSFGSTGDVIIVLGLDFYSE